MRMLVATPMSAPPRAAVLATVLGLGSACATVVTPREVDSLASATCDPAAPADCRIVPRSAFQFVYMPIDDERVRAAKEPRTPRSLEIIIQCCVEPERGRLAHVEVIADGGAPEIAAALVEQMGPWRAKPAKVDGQPVFGCTQLLFEVKFTRRLDRRS